MSVHPNCDDDPLSSVLSLVGLECAPVVRVEAGGSWAIRFASHLPITFGVVVEGGAWLATETGEEPIWLAPGDCFLVMGTRPHQICSDRTAEAKDAAELFARHRGSDGVVRCGTGQKTALIGGGFNFQANGALLLDLLPPRLHLAATRQPPPLRSTLRALAEEVASSQLGGKLMTQNLAQALFVQVLRDYAASQACSAVGWLGAFADRQIGAALRLLHSDDGKRWTLPGLAAAVGMSRSGFALRFKTLVGAAPLEYLLRWRMQRAGRALRNMERTLAAIASEFGYSSESAFSHAFKRVQGCPPRQYRARGSMTVGDRLACCEAPVVFTPRASLSARANMVVNKNSPAHAIQPVQTRRRSRGPKIGTAS